MALSVGSSAPNLSLSGAVYWVGNDGNVYLKSGGGVSNKGRASGTGTTANLVLQGARQISNPGNAGGSAPAGSATDPTAALLASIARLQNAQPRQTYAPSLDFASINAKARSQAESNVNPYYAKQLNDFLASQAAARSQTEVQTQTTIGQLEEDLKNKLAANQVTGQRTTEDTAANQAKINTQQDQFQTDSGQQFTADRLDQARKLAAAGLTGGLGAQQAEATTLARNTTEKRAAEEAQQAKQDQELSKARTFEDLATSGSLATAAKESGVKQANTSLSDFITNQGLDLTAKQTQLESARQADIVQQSDQARSILVQGWINSIADPASRQAALSAYGGLL